MPLGVRVAGGARDARDASGEEGEMEAEVGEDGGDEAEWAREHRTGIVWDEGGKTRLVGGTAAEGAITGWKPGEGSGELRRRKPEPPTSLTPGNAMMAECSFSRATRGASDERSSSVGSTQYLGGLGGAADAFELEGRGARGGSWGGESDEIARARAGRNNLGAGGGGG